VSSSVGRPSGPIRSDLPALGLLRQLTQLSRAVAEAASLDDILGLAAKQAAAILGADQTVVMLVGEDGVAHVRAAEGVDRQVVESWRGELNEQLIMRLSRLLRGSSARAFMAVPLIVQGEVTGLIAVTRPEPDPWTSEEEAVLAAVADQSAAPIEIARLTLELRQARLIAENARLTEAERAARAELEAERARLATVLDHMPVGVVLAEAPSGRISFRNRAVFRLSGVAETPVTSIDDYGQLQGLRPDGSSYRKHEWPLARALLHGESVMGEEIELILRDGHHVIFSMNAAPIRDAEGAIVAAVSSFHDVTQRRRVEQHLRQAQQMEAVGRLAGGMAHEANNQMSVVLSASAFILQRGDIPEPVRHDVESIKRAAERTAAVTAQLLAFGRRQLLRPVVLDINQVVREFMPALRRTLGENFEVELRADDTISHIKADRGQVEQVLLNLTLNARDAMPRGGRLELETGSVTLTEQHSGFKPDVFVRPGTYVVLSVRDTGQGMDPSTLEHAFEPFFTTKPVGQGTGLGLSTVYGIVKQSGGYVWAYSEGGRGTTVKVYLPAIQDPVELAPVAQPAPAGSAGEVVLVVEDEESVRTMIARTLDAEGYQVREAGDGQEALALLEENAGAVDLIITDLAMPQLSGRELAERVGRSRPDLPVLFISGYTDDEMIRRGLIEPDQPFISKPFTPDTLAARVRALLDQAATRGTRSH
jgi:two-component system, cell cycle sensor histidine kinase and response regulator CckA